MHKTTVEVSAERLLAWLESYDLTDANAAKLLGVRPNTINAWTKRGAAGVGGRLLRLLLRRNESPYKVARELDIQLSSSLRSQSRRQVPVKAFSDAGAPPPPKVELVRYEWWG